jgi:hypothetical protein
MRFLHLVEAAKIAARRSARVLRREPRGQGVPLRQLQMSLHFVVQRPIEAAAAGQGIVYGERTKKEWRDVGTR